MSGTVACWHRDGRPVEGELDRMMDAAKGRGADGRAVWRDGPVALGQLHTATSGDDRGPKLSVDTGAGVTVVVHGRVHDPAALAAVLGLPDDSPGDADLVLCAYRRWGTHLMRRVMGDLAVIIWDRSRRRLVACTDHQGFRPIVWWTDRRHVLVASEMSQLVAHSAVGVHTNEAMLAEAYTNRLRTPGETLLHGIRRVQPGHVLVLAETGGGGREEPWGEPPFTRPAHRRTADWIDEYRTTFTQAVGSAFDTATPPTVTVSGGLDSSSILCTAARAGYLDRGADLVTYDVDHDGGDHPAYTEAIAEATGFTIERLTLTRYDWSRTIDVVGRRFTLPMRPNAALHRIVIDRTAAAERSVVLTGEGGDEWLTYMSRFWPEHLARGHVSQVVRGAWARSSDGPVRAALRTARLVAHGGVVPLIGRRLGRPRPPMTEVPVWLAPDFVRRVELADRLHHWQRSEPRGPVFPAQYSEYHGGLEIESANAGIEYRHPFQDRRLVELMFALPEELTVRDGVNKWLLRQAMDGILPPVIASRPGKGHFTPYLERGIADVLGSLGGIEGLGNLLGVQHGYLGLGGVTEMATRSLDCARRGEVTSKPIESILSLWAVLSADIWLAVQLGVPPPVPLTVDTRTPTPRLPQPTDIKG